MHTNIHINFAQTHWATICLRNRRQRSRSRLWWFWWACHRCWQLWWPTTGPCSAHEWRNSTPPARRPILASGGSAKRSSSLSRRTPRAKAAAPSVYLEVWSFSLLSEVLISHESVLRVKIQWFRGKCMCICLLSFSLTAPLAWNKQCCTVMMRKLAFAKFTNNFVSEKFNGLSSSYIYHTLFKPWFWHQVSSCHD